MKIFLALILALPLPAESLRYSVNWPSGLSLGEMTLHSDKTAGQRSLGAEIDASFPGFPLREHAQSTATAELCSTVLDKNSVRGARVSAERILFDQANHTATRESKTGGHSQMQVPPCAHDALAFLEFVREELAQGRLASPQPVVFGSLYQVRLSSKGMESIRVGETKMDADRLAVTVTGPASACTFELYFARDAARTPVLAKIPSPLGTFTVELAP